MLKYDEGPIVVLYAVCFAIIAAAGIHSGYILYMVW